MIAFALLATALGGCNKNIRGITTTPERRVWVIESETGKDRLYRCVDEGADADEPRPVCMPTPIGATR